MGLKQRCVEHGTRVPVSLMPDFPLADDGRQCAFIGVSAAVGERGTDCRSVYGLECERDDQELYCEWAVEKSGQIEGGLEGA